MLTPAILNLDGWLGLAGRFSEADIRRQTIDIRLIRQKFHNFACIL